MVINTKSEVQINKNELHQRLISIMRKTGYQIIQINGQRIFCPPTSLRIPTPPKGCEVFIGRLKKDIFEDQLIPLFSRVGGLYKFRLMLDFLEQNRGYAFATYFNQEDADKAVKELNNHEIRPGHSIRVHKSVDNRRLFVGNLPTDKSPAEVFNLLTNYVEGITQVIMIPDNEYKKQNKGYAFIEFQDHRLATMARRQLTPDNLMAWDRTLHVEWADPEPEVTTGEMAKVKVIILRQLPSQISRQTLILKIFEVLDPKIVKKIFKKNNYAFIHFASREIAETALDLLQKYLRFGEQEVKIEFSRPVKYSKKNRLARGPPNNSCLSVPPNLRRLVRNKTNVGLCHVCSGSSYNHSECSVIHFSTHS